jgi:ABC-type multidrug transport system ATPase subunit
VSIIGFDGVSKSFDGRKVLDCLRFSVDRSQVYGLLGPNGCGKSTAINILCNLLDPDEGRVQIGDTTSAEPRQILGYGPQEIALYRDLLPAENLRFFAQVYGLSGSDRDRRVVELSGFSGLIAMRGHLSDRFPEGGSAG